MTMFWNTNDCIAKLTISFTSSVSLRDRLVLKICPIMNATTNAEKVNIKVDFAWL